MYEFSLFHTLSRIKFTVFFYNVAIFTMSGYHNFWILLLLFHELQCNFSSPWRVRLWRFRRRVDMNAGYMWKIKKKKRLEKDVQYEI